MMPTKKEKNINIKWIIYSAIVIFTILVFRLVYLQLMLEDDLLHRSRRNYTRNQQIKPFRGLIVDCNGNYLATNEAIINIFWVGSGNISLTSEQKNLVEKLSEKINIINKEQISTAEKYKKNIVISKNISKQELFSILKYISSEKNIKIETSHQRFYPNGSLASHIVGYLGITDDSGRMGIEKICEPLLAGNSGQKKVTINAYGSHISSSLTKKAENGENINLTIDLKLQEFAEDLFPSDISGAMILMNPEDGAIKTIISRPNFDPNLFLEPITKKQWEEITAQGPFINRALSATYPPASLFKLVTIAAALEEKIIDQETLWECKGFTTFAKRRYHCARRYGHGEVDAKKALAHSCNIPFYDIGTKITIDKLTSYANKFGLGEYTGIFMDEKKGLMPTNNWKIENKGDRWWPGETLSAVIGQSFLLTTPIQMARMLCSIVDGYLTTPRLIQEEPVIKKKLDISKPTREFLLESMKTAVVVGTGRKISKIKDITVYAKTGTAQTSSLEKRNLGKKFKEHTWFIGSIQYKEEKPLVMVIIFEHCGNHKEIQSYAKSFLMRYRNYCSHKE